MSKKKPELPKRVKVTVEIDDQKPIVVEFEKLLDISYSIQYDIEKIWGPDGLAADLRYTGRKNFQFSASEFKETEE